MRGRDYGTCWGSSRKGCSRRGHSRNRLRDESSRNMLRDESRSVINKNREGRSREGCLGEPRSKRGSSRQVKGKGKRMEEA